MKIDMDAFVKSQFLVMLLVIVEESKFCLDAKFLCEEGRLVVLQMTKSQILKTFVNFKFVILFLLENI